jgi:hypothetical protein
MLVVILSCVIACQSIALWVLRQKLKNVKYDGTVEVHEDEDTKTFSFKPDGDLYDLDKRKEVRLRVELHSVGRRE